MYYTGIFSSLRGTDKDFQLVRSIFSLHFEIFFLLGEPKASLVIKRLKHENWNALSQLKGWIKIPRDATWLFKSKHTFIDLVTVKSCFNSLKIFQEVLLVLTQNSFQNNQKSALWLEKFYCTILLLFAHCKAAHFIHNGCWASCLILFIMTSGSIQNFAHVCFLFQHVFILVHLFADCCWWPKKTFGMAF